MFLISGCNAKDNFKLNTNEIADELVELKQTQRFCNECIDYVLLHNIENDYSSICVLLCSQHNIYDRENRIKELYDLLPLI